MRFCVFQAAVLILVSARAEAQSLPSGGPSSDRAVGDVAAAPERAAAHAHFESALSLYRAGKYRRAVAELEAALERDPSGKDLVYNLALVQEKLGDFEGAISSLRRFQTMETDPAELDRAAQTLQRLEGARAELNAVGPARPSSPTPCPPRFARGRFDAWVLGSGGVAVAALLVGTAFGVRALTLDPRGESTGPGTSFDSLRSRAERARTAAIVADVAFSTSLLAGAAAATLYFGRYPDSGPTQHALVPSPAPRISAAWLELRF